MIQKMFAIKMLNSEMQPTFSAILPDRQFALQAQVAMMEAMNAAITPENEEVIEKVKASIEIVPVEVAQLS